MNTETAPATVSVTALDPNAGLLTVINTYVVAPERAETLLNTLVSATHDVLRHVPGFVSANFHLNAERTQLVNYAQWRSREALAAAKDFPGVMDRIGEAGKIAESFNPVQYDLRLSIAGSGA